jgi:hypothetical protein
MNIYKLGYKRCSLLLLRDGTNRGGFKGEGTGNKGRKSKVIRRENMKEYRQKKKKKTFSISGAPWALCSGK